MDEKHQQMVADRVAGMSYQAIAEKHGVNHLTARRACKKAVRMGLVTKEEIRTNRHFGEKRGPKLTAEQKIQHIFSKVTRQPNGCWEYPAWKNASGHVHTVHDNETWLVHRLVWTLTRGPIPDGLVVMHQCDNGCCCNPDHLKLGTRAENNIDMHTKGRSNYSKARKTHCKHGHEFTPENTAVRGGFRQCRECNRLRQRRDYVRPEKAPLTRDQLRQQRYRVRRKARLAANNVSG